MLSIKRYRRAAVPILAVQTADPMDVLRQAVSEVGENPILHWDVIHGITAKNSQAKPIEGELNQGAEPAMATGNPSEAMRAIANVGERLNKTTFVAFGLADQLEDPSQGAITKQALWNLRDVLTQSTSIFVMCVPMGWVNPFPDDIAVAVMDLPKPSALIALTKSLCSENSLDVPDDDTLTKIGDALTGLSNFAAEQAVALSIDPDTKVIDLEILRERKRQQISETPGLSVFTGQEKFADLGGLEQAKKLFTAFVNGKRKPGAIVFIDEIEKSLGGAGTDSSGVSQSMLGYLLSYMQDQNATGSIFVGPPGAAKSAFAKAIGGEADIPTVSLDLGGVKNSLVGQSEGQMRKALAVITAISGGKAFFCATCNAIKGLPPELRRRFTLGTMFFDLPNASERKVIWDLYKTRYSLEGETPESEGWTGAEIRQCADLADRLSISLAEAATYVVPVSVAARESISRLRSEASGRYLSASEPGVYTATETTGRKLEK